MSGRYKRLKMSRGDRMRETVAKQLDGQERYAGDLKFYLEKVGDDPWARRSLEAVEQRIGQLREALERMNE